MRSKWNPGCKPTPVGWIPCPVQNRESILANPESILADRGLILANPESIPADPKWHEMHGIPMKTYRPGQPGNHPSAPKRHPGQPEGFVAWAPNGRAPYSTRRTPPPPVLPPRPFLSSHLLPPPSLPLPPSPSSSLPPPSPLFPPLPPHSLLPPPLLLLSPSSLAPMRPDLGAERLRMLRIGVRALFIRKRSAPRSWRI